MTKKITQADVDTAYHMGRASAFSEAYLHSLKRDKVMKHMVCKNCTNWNKRGSCKITKTAVCGSDMCMKWRSKANG